MFQHKFYKKAWLSLLTVILALTLLPFSALALSENTLEAAPEISPAGDLPEETPAAGQTAEASEDSEYIWDSSRLYLPQCYYWADRGTLPEEDQYSIPRLSDWELERYKKLLVQLEDGQISLQGIQPSINRRDSLDDACVFLLQNPEDYAGKTFYVLLPRQKMDDKNLLTLIASFRELGIDFDPDSLNELNCARGYRSTRSLTSEENARWRTLESMIVRGRLKKEDISLEPGVLCSDPLPGYGTFGFYPYRSMTDDELASCIFAEASAWETDPDLIEQTALKAVRDMFRLPLSMKVSSETKSVIENNLKAFSGETFNQYSITFDAENPYRPLANGELESITIDLYEDPGKPPVLYGFIARYWHYDDVEETYDPNDHNAFTAIARQWIKDTLLLAGEEMQANWLIKNTGYGEVEFCAEINGWEFYLDLDDTTGLPAFFSAWYRMEYNTEQESYLPGDARPSARAVIPEEEANKPLEESDKFAGSPWLTDLELARARVLMAALDAGEITYDGPSMVNAPFNDRSYPAVYTLNPQNFDGETFFVLMPECSMNDAKLLALISAFKDLGIPFDPDSLNERNCSRFSNSIASRWITSEERERFYYVLDRIFSGNLTKADITAGTQFLTTERTTSRVWGSSTDLFCFTPYRQMTNDELALMAFAKIEGWDTDPYKLESAALKSLSGYLAYPDSAELTDVNRTRMDFYGREVADYEFEFFPNNSGWFGSCYPHWTTVKFRQEAGREAEFAGIMLDYAYTELNDKTYVYSAAEAKQTWIAAAEKWAEENLKLPKEVLQAGWTFVEKDTGRGSGARVQLQLLTDELDIRLWIDYSSLQPDKCYVYSRKWYSSDDANGYLF